MTPCGLIERHIEANNAIHSFHSVTQPGLVQQLFDELKDDFYVCALDTPGYGFSDKPLDGYDYSIDDDARLVDEYVRDIAGLREFALLTHDKGDSVGLALLQVYQAYDNERAENEVGWLEGLAKSEIPTTLIWGELDAIAPVAVPDHVWTNYLEDRETPAAYWRVPCADHYLQVDDPGLIADILRATLAEDPPPAEIEGQACRAVQIQANQ